MQKNPYTILKNLFKNFSKKDTPLSLESPTSSSNNNKIKELLNQENGKREEREESPNISTPKLLTSPTNIWISKDEEELSNTLNIYCTALINLHDDNILETQLPYPSQKNLPLLKKIIETLESEITIWDETIPEENREIERLRKIIEKCKEKINIINSPTNQHTDTNPNDNSTNKSINLIFATTTTDRIRFIEDLKSISPKYYPHLKSLLNTIKNYQTISGNNEKYKLLNSTNKALQSIREVKGFKIRIYFKPINPNCMYIYMAYQKEHDWSQSDYQKLEKRIRNQNPQYTSLQEGLNSEERDKIIKKHQQIEQKIYQILNNQIRGEDVNELQLYQ